MSEPTYKEQMLEALKRVPKTIKLTHISAQTGIPAHALRTFRGRGTLGSGHLRKLEYWLTASDYIEWKPGKVFVSHPSVLNQMIDEEYGNTTPLPTYEEFGTLLDYAKNLNNPKLDDDILKLLETKWTLLGQATELRTEFDKLLERVESILLKRLPKALLEKTRATKK